MKYHVTIQMTRMSLAKLTAMVAACVPEEAQETAEIAGNTIQFDTNGPLTEIAASLEDNSESITKFWVTVN